MSHSPPTAGTARRTPVPPGDALNRESRKQLANGLTVSHQYDAAGQELVLANRKADGAGVGIYPANRPTGNRAFPLGRERDSSCLHRARFPAHGAPGTDWPGTAASSQLAKR